MSIVARVIASVSATISSGKLREKDALRIVEKIRLADSSDMSANARKLKWRRKRGVTGLRPPPGGPMQPMNCTSMILRKVHGGLRSYHPSWSIHWRRSSMGGCAKYFSRCGMFRSSTHTT